MLFSIYQRTQYLDHFDVGHENQNNTWRNLGIIPVSLELMNLSSNDPKNAQGAMSRFAGKLALQDALQHYAGKSPRKSVYLVQSPRD